MAIRRSDQRRDGRYVHGGKTTSSGNRLGWWERRVFDESPSDVPFVVTKRYALRPDLLAYDMYGRANLMWFILQYNNVSDITVDFVEGSEIVLPTAQRLFGELLTGFSL